MYTPSKNFLSFYRHLFGLGLATDAPLKALEARDAGRVLNEAQAQDLHALQLAQEAFEASHAPEGGEWIV